MDQQEEQFWQAIDDHIMDAMQLIRLAYPNFNSVAVVDKIMQHLNAAYRASGKAADAVDKGWIQ